MIIVKVPGRVPVIVLLLSVNTLTGCDPVHEVKLENKTNKSVEVVVGPLDDYLLNENTSIDTLTVAGKQYGITKLGSGQLFPIGHVTAHYDPRPDDLYFNYLEIRTAVDTAKFIGNTAIFSALHKEGDLDWRLIIRNE